MSASEWYKRQKSKLKKAFAQNQSTASLPDPSKAPQLSGPTSQLAEDPAKEKLRDTTSSLSLSSTQIAPLSAPSNQQDVKHGIVTTSEVSLPDPDAGNSRSPADDEVAVTVPKLHREQTPKTEGQRGKLTWSGLKTLLGALSSGIGAFSPLEPAVRGLEYCINIFEQASKARDDYQELGEQIDRLLGDLAQFNSWIEKPMTTCVKNLCSDIETEIMIIEEKQGRSAPERYLEATEDLDAIHECYRRIHGHVQRLMLNANLNMWKTLDEEMTDRRLLHLSPTMSGAYDSWASDRAKRRQCARGTRVQELEGLQTWLRDPLASPIYWINGMAGTGKTTIAYTFCDGLSATGELAASFFCTRLIPECRNIRLIIPAIAYQLAQFSYPFRHELSKALESDREAHTRRLDLQFQMLISRPLEAVRHTLPSGFVVVIDALDECEDRDSIGNMLDLLVGSASDLPVRFLVSSRPEPEIYRRMMKQVGGDPSAKLVLHELDPNDVQHDIEAYLREELEDIPLTAKQWSALLERCGGLFIYASTACRYIKSGDEMMSYEEAVDTVLGLSFEGTRDTEKELDKLYMSILEGAFTMPHISEANKKRMKMVLDTIVCAQEPMTTEALAGLLGLKNAEHTSTLLRPLFSMINLAQDTGIAATLHASFPDFMFSPDRSAGFHCAATRQHIELTLICLGQIRSNPVQFNICGIESSYLLDDEIPDLPERAERAVSPALLYSCCHLAGHLELSGPSAKLQEPVLDFLTARLLLWMEVLNVKKKLDVGSAALDRIMKWCQVARMSKDTIDLARDAGGFFSSYRGWEACQSTAHIYTSMLTFWPSYCPIAKYYMPRTTGMLQPQGTAVDKCRLPVLAVRNMGEPMQAVCYSSDGVHIAASVGNDIYMLDGWNLQPVLGPFEGHTDLVTSIAVSPDGVYIASGSYDSTIRVWNSKNGELITDPIKAHHDRVTSVAFSPDSTRIVSTGAFDCLRVWSVQNGKKIASAGTRDRTECICTAVFSADGSRILSGHGDRAICFWDAQTGELISEQPGQHLDHIESLAFSADGLRFASTSIDGTINIWDTGSQQIVLKLFEEWSKDVNQATFSPNNSYIATTKYGGVRLWDAKSGDFFTVILGPSLRPVKSVAFSPDGSRFTACCDDGIVSICDTEHAVKIDTYIRRTQGGIHSACFSSDGLYIVTGARDGSIGLWDTSTGELVTGPLTGHKGYVCSVAISSDGAYIASASSDKTIRLWDLKGAEGAYKLLEHHTKRVDSLSFTSDNTQLLYGSLIYSIGVSPFTSDTPSGLDDSQREEWAAQVFSIKGSSIASSPDGVYVASGSTDGTVQMWHAQTGQLIIGPLRAHADAVSRILFSPDGAHMVSCSIDDTIRFWPIPGIPDCDLEGSHSSVFNEEASVSSSRILAREFDKNGWIISDRGEHLAWVPPNLRMYFLLPGNDLLISHIGSLKLDFSNASIGELWTECYHPT
ncbi:hypothetical protein B0J17DRAFT_711035 [Rhizoctonia solani]|nr:hypothetical protein B0J17DRAFT_711035 [Rhizoctonia solani]